MSHDQLDCLWSGSCSACAVTATPLDSNQLFSLACEACRTSSRRCPQLRCCSACTSSYPRLRLAARSPTTASKAATPNSDATGGAGAVPTGSTSFSQRRGGHPASSQIERPAVRGRSRPTRGTRTSDALSRSDSMRRESMETPAWSPRPDRDAASNAVRRKPVPRAGWRTPAGSRSLRVPFPRQPLEARSADRSLLQAIRLSPCGRAHGFWPSSIARARRRLGFFPPSRFRISSHTARGGLGTFDGLFGPWSTQAQSAHEVVQPQPRPLLASR